MYAVYILFTDRAQWTGHVSKVEWAMSPYRIHAPLCFGPHFVHTAFSARSTPVHAAHMLRSWATGKASVLLRQFHKFTVQAWSGLTLDDLASYTEVR